MLVEVLILFVQLVTAPGILWFNVGELDQERVVLHFEHVQTFIPPRSACLDGIRSEGRDC